MTKIIIYTKKACGYCESAKQLLKNLNQTFSEISLDEFPERQDEMIEKSNKRTVPQIFINDKPIGGFDDLYALHKDGKLAKILQG